MSKKKLKRFEENKTFPHLFQPTPEEMYEKDFHLKGNWNKDYFKNDNPIILEVGCGKGEYTNGLAIRNPGKNYIGIDIKGPRLWKGSKVVQEEGIKNVCFVRNKVEFLGSFFREKEISEIWITFPDPQIRKMKKRLTSARFLKIYSGLLKSDGIIHLKTDSCLMHKFTKKIIILNKLELLYSTEDVYCTDLKNEVTEIKTYYEQKFLDKSQKISYLKFKIADIISFINYKNEKK